MSNIPFIPKASPLSKGGLHRRCLALVFLLVSSRKGKRLSLNLSNGIKGKGKRRCLALVLLLIFGLVSCQQATKTATAEVIRVYPHDETAFTQGLLLYDGKLYESTGLYGESQLREVDLASGEVMRSLDLNKNNFGEGLARVDDKLIQITWREGDAFVYDLATFEQTGQLRYDSEGWGLCYDGSDLYMTDGSPILYRRDPETLQELGNVTVTTSKTGQESAVNNLNELECVGDYVYANVWQTDLIVKIDKKTGRVVTEINAASLLSPAERAGFDPNAVLNGIAYNPASDTFYLTGKLWPKLFEVKFIEK
jgi:glutaminyl-peptide cyclotransferase